MSQDKAGGEVTPRLPNLFGEPLLKAAPAAPPDIGGEAVLGGDDGKESDGGGGAARSFWVVERSTNFS